jgi:hypothetical protein
VQRDGAAREAAAEAADHNLPREGALLQARGARPSEAAHCGPAHTRGAALERARSSGRGSGVRRSSARAAGGERGAGARGPSAGRPVWSRRPTGGPRRKVAAARGNSDLGARQVGVEGAPSRSWRLASRTCDARKSDLRRSQVGLVTATSRTCDGHKSDFFFVESPSCPTPNSRGVTPNSDSARPQPRVSSYA